MNFLSLCVLAKDAGKGLERSLESAKGIAGEIVVVNAGTAGKAKKAAAGFTDKIYDFAGEDGSGGAENFAVSMAKGDWILWLEPGEELSLWDLPGLFGLLSETEGKRVCVKTLRYGRDGAQGSGERSLKNACISYEERLFKNDETAKFEGSVPRLSPAGEPEIFGAAGIHCEGPPEEAFSSGFRGYAEVPGDAGEEYHRAARCWKDGDAPRAQKLICDEISKLEKEKIRPPADFYKLKYALADSMGQGAETDGIERAVQSWPDCADLHFYRGRALYGSGEYAAAAEAFTYCLILGEVHPRYIVTAGAGSFLALCNLGLCDEALGMEARAAEAYRQALLICPEFPEAAERLARLKGRA